MKWALLGVGAASMIACGGTTDTGKTTGAPGGASGSGGAATGGSLVTGGSSSGGSPGAGGNGKGGAITGGTNSGGSSTGGASGGTGGSSGAGGTGLDAGIGGAGGGADAGAIRCGFVNPSFPVFDRGCTNAEGCVLVSHLTSCCGSSKLMGINREERERFDAAEAICDAQYPLCGCASSDIELDDGVVVRSSGEAVLECASGNCRSRYKGDTFACGAKTCTTAQYCIHQTGGPAGNPATYGCVEDPNCAKSCAGCSNAGCTCSSVQGHTVVTCAYP